VRIAPAVFKDRLRVVGHALAFGFLASGRTIADKHQQSVGRVRGFWRCASQDIDQGIDPPGQPTPARAQPVMLNRPLTTPI
jgi:hypothetical protein